MKINNIFVVAKTNINNISDFYIYLNNINGSPNYTPKIYEAELMTLDQAKESIRLLKDQKNLEIVSLSEAIKNELMYYRYA